MVALMLVALPASAAVIESGESYYLPENKTIDDNLYATASYIDIAGNVSGDFVGAGGNVMVTGEIDEDVSVAGGTVDLWGNIGDDVRVTGGKILLAGDIGGDLLAAGGLVQMRPNVTVGGDAIAAGGMVVMIGNFRDDVNLSGGSVALGGSVRGNATVKFSESLTIAEGTTITGDFDYYGPKEIEMPSNVVINGEVRFHQTAPSGVAAPKVTPDALEVAGEFFAGIIIFFWVMCLIGTLILALLAVLLYQKKSTEIVRSGMKQFGWNILRGFLVMIFVPLALLVLVVSVIGFIPAVYLGLLYFAVYIEAMVFAGIIFGSMIFKWIKRTKEYEISWGSAIVGVLLLSVLRLIPLLGWVLWMIFLFVAMGAIANMVYQYYWVKRNKA